MEIIYNGHIYTRRDGKWISENQSVAPKSLQADLNNLFFETINSEDLSTNQLIKMGDDFKRNNSEHLAIKCYKKALGECCENEVRYVLPRLTSCLRIQGKSKEVIETFSNIKKKWGSKLFNEALLTSISAAYCDLGEYENAKKCADIAFSKGGYKASYELKIVYNRIKKESELYK